MFRTILARFKPRCKFSEIADKVERWLGHPVALALFLAWCAFLPLLNVDVANYGISVATAFVLFLTLGSSRRDRRAMHAKLDDLECAVEGADNEMARLEELREDEIEERRNGKVTGPDQHGTTPTT